MSDWGEARTKTVTWHDPAISRAAAATMTGREFLEAMIDGRLPPPPFAQLTGAELVSAGDGVSFLSPANGTTLEVEGRALRVGRQIAFAEAHARTAGGKLVGHATTSLALLRG